MPDMTTNYQLEKATENEWYEVELHGRNMEKIDTDLKVNADLAAAAKTKADAAETPAGAQAKVDAAIAALLSGAPGALDTLNELAAALGDDPNFATTIITALGTKVEQTTYNEHLANYATFKSTAEGGISTLESAVSSIIGVRTATITTTWEGASAPYTQTIAVAGVTANDEPAISPIYSTTLATAILEKEAWNMVGKIETGAGSITATCFADKPITAIPIQIKGV